MKKILLMILLLMPTMHVFAVPGETVPQSQQGELQWDMQKLFWTAVGVSAVFIPKIAQLKNSFINVMRDNDGKSMNHLLAYLFVWGKEAADGGVKLTPEEERDLIEQNKAELEKYKKNPVKFKAKLEELADKKYSVRHQLKDKNADILQMLVGFDPSQQGLNVNVVDGVIGDPQLEKAAGVFANFFKMKE